MTTGTARITISRLSGGPNDGSIRFAFEDKATGVQFLVTEMSPEAFAEAITGMSSTCSFELHAHNIGKERESKYENIFMPWAQRNAHHRRGNAAKILARYETDGWIGQLDDLLNPHRMVRTGDENGEEGGYYKVLFERFV